MKHLKVFLTLLVTIVVILGGCQKIDEPQAPELIYPPDSAVLDKLPLTLVWSSSSAEDHYSFKLWFTLGMLDTMVYLSLHDTTYTITDEQLGAPYAVSFTWSVASISDSLELWSGTRAFEIDRAVDLDTTYFPLGLGYEWCYEQYSYRYHWDAHDPDDQYWYSYDTFTIKVVDSAFTSDGLSFKWVGGWFNDLGGGPNLEPTIIGSKVKIVWYSCYSDSILLSLYPDSGWYHGTGVVITVSYAGDTLSLGKFEPCGWGFWGDYDRVSSFTFRIKGIGIVVQADSMSQGDHAGEGDIDRLLWFYNGRDTVYKAK